MRISLWDGDQVGLKLPSDVTKICTISQSKF